MGMNVEEQTQKEVKEKSGIDSVKDPEVTLEDHMAQAREVIRKYQEGDSGEEPEVPEEKLEINAVSSDQEVDAVSGADPGPPPEEKFKKRVNSILEQGENSAADFSAAESRLQKQSNTEVVLAMQIAEEKLAMAQASGEMSKDHPRYVVHGARLVCSCGTREARLVVPLDHGVHIRSHPQLSVMDSKSLMNIKCFGNCTSINNPLMEETAVEAVRRFNDANPKGLFIKSAEIDPSPELLSLCICECIPKFMQLCWSDGNDRHLINGAKTLTQQGKIVCEHGGIIRIYMDGQDE